METPKFNLSDYTQSILQIAQQQGISPEAALQCFVANLAVMRECYKGAPTLNYHTLGQQWNRLTSADRNAQKAETKVRLSRYNNNSRRSDN